MSAPNIRPASGPVMESLTRAEVKIVKIVGTVESDGTVKLQPQCTERDA